MTSIFINEKSNQFIKVGFDTMIIDSETDKDKLLVSFDNDRLRVMMDEDSIILWELYVNNSEDKGIGMNMAGMTTDVSDKGKMIIRKMLENNTDDLTGLEVSHFKEYIFNRCLELIQKYDSLVQVI